MSLVIPISGPSSPPSLSDMVLIQQSSIVSMNSRSEQQGLDPGRGSGSVKCLLFFFAEVDDHYTRADR